MRYYIADCHFYHRALLNSMDHRGFQDVDEMNAYMIKQWNEKVKRSDEVVILGDFSMGNAQETNRILEELKGKLYLIVGNHDNKYLRNKEFHRERFQGIYPYAELHDNNRKVILSHYPIPCYNGQYLKTKNNDPRTYMLYGHVHDTHDEKLLMDFVNHYQSTEIVNREGEKQKLMCNMINCFCMYSDYTPLSLDEWIELTKKRFADCGSVKV